MPSYFRQVPNFDYVSRDSNQRQISEYATVKNLFRRGKLRDDIFGNLSYFTKYQIIGDERPDNVAYKLYNDETLDWVILLSNNTLSNIVCGNGHSVWIFSILLERRITQSRVSSL